MSEERRFVPGMMRSDAIVKVYEEWLSDEDELVLSKVVAVDRIHKKMNEMEAKFWKKRKEESPDSDKEESQTGKESPDSDEVAMMFWTTVSCLYMLVMAMVVLGETKV